MVLRRLPARRPPDGGAVERGERPVGLLPGLPGPLRRAAGRDLDRAAAGQGADDRGVRVQEVDRAAVPLPRQLPGLQRELPAADVRRPGRAVRGRPGDRPGPRHAADPARRPRAELLHVDRAAGRLLARQPLRLGLGGGQRALRPAARRGQPGRARDAGADRGRRRRHRRVRAQGQGEGRRRQADGLRAPGLPQLRPAGGARQGRGPRRHRAHRRRRPDARPRHAAGGDRARRPVLRRAAALPQRGLLHRR